MLLSRRWAFLALISLINIAPLVALTGCADVISYSAKSQEEGMRFYTEKAYGDAAGAFRNAIRQDPRDFRSHYYLGVCYDEMHMHQQAFSAYRTALDVMTQIKANYSDEQFRQTILDTLGSSIARHDSGDVELNKLEARAKSSQKAEDWFVIAKAYRLRGDVDRAMDAYRRATLWDNEDFYIRKEYGLYLLDPLHQNKDAEYYLRQANRLDPNDAAVNAGLTRLCVTPLPAYKAKEDPARISAQKGVNLPAPRSTALLPRD